MIEKRITHQLLETGELNLTERECSALVLPEHSASIDIELDGEPFHAQWSGRSRQLTGDVLSERLQDYGQDGGLLRLRLVDQTYRLQLLPPDSQTQIIIPPPPVTRVMRPVTKKAKRRATVDRQFHADGEYDWGTGTPTVGFLTAARELVGDQLKAGGFDPLELVELRLQGEELATLDDFEELLAVDVANVDRMPHQESVAKHALSRLRGRAVLADEVGLGKTVEAGLAVKELALRGLAKRVLILCPAPLRDQWREEMTSKFDLSFDVAYRGPEIQKQDKLILSLTLARSNAAQLTKKPWDVVIIDEAHRAAGRGALKTRNLITSLTTACRYALFLTATPVQNDLLELYRLVELLRPGTFESEKSFSRQFMKSHDPRTPNDPAALRRLISSVMVRTTRAQAGVDRVVRRAIDVPVELGAREKELYTLSTHLLRNVMRDSGDSMRRRSLALRLTASPFSMGTTALRMAERHQDPRVRSVLNEVGHLAMDINGSARENKALEITHDWLRQHGRVLIFTQHTDTVSGLLRRMQAEGVTARAFHGSMSTKERAATIAAFRSGDAPVMISTDAGAEGQNLQFCNCVLNYDLPWNPMRIEQRIGRVDRLTQPKDEVFVANLYARKTIDESVYQLLAQKLRMFELLFGQVTTILGELDDAKSATFETRVMEALFSDTDSKMDGLLKQLGTELVHAREKASELIAADSGLSNWMTSAFEHRKGLTKAGSTDLAPAVSERARMRQRRVQTWVRNVLKALDVQLLHDTGEGEGAFITVQFDEEYEQELGGRTLVHLAFDRLGLEHHPDAELCAVGSPVFEELLSLLRMRGDLHATVPIVPEDIGPSRSAHAPTIKLVSRRLVPSGSWSGQATFRATIGEAETTEHLITSDLNGHNQQRMERRPLPDGESLPVAFGTTSKLIKNFERAAASQLESLRRSRAKKVESDQTQELHRITVGYKAQISETAGDDRQRLQRALRSEERRLNRQPDVRARAKLLALTLDEDDWVVEEAWEGPSGAVGKLTYEYGPDPSPAVVSAASGRDVNVLALCSSAHWVDRSETTHCDSCNGELCTACGDDGVFADCAVCGLSSCGICRTETGGLCRRCGTPERTPALDTEFAIAWTLNGSSILRVGERVAELTKPGADVPLALVPIADIGDAPKARIRAYAKQQNLPMDCGLVLRDLTRQPDALGSDRTRLTSTATIGVELSVSDDSVATVDARAAADLPQLPDVGTVAEHAVKLDTVLKQLREAVPPKRPPAMVVTRRSTFVDTYLEADRLVQETATVTDDGAVAVVDVQFAEFHWNVPTIKDALIATAEIGAHRVLLQRRNDAVLVTLKQESQDVAQWIACPDEASVSFQIGSYNYLSSLGTPGARLGKRKHEILTISSPFPQPSECEIVRRDITQVARLIEAGPDVDVTTADDVSLSALGIIADTEAAQKNRALPTELSAALVSRATFPFSTVMCNGLEVSEVWRGHSDATHTYTTFDGEALSPTTHDHGIRATDFGVCRDGHFYSAGSAALCESCDSWACKACDEIDQRASLQCSSCAHAVCRRCLAASHSVPSASCLLCGDKACAGCGRNPEVAACSMCDRAMCANCRAGGLCPACATISPITEEQRQLVPKELSAEGATILRGHDPHATVLLINRGKAYEQAIIRDDQIARWVAFGRSDLDSTYKLRLRASQQLGAQVNPVVMPTDADIKLTGQHVVVSSEMSFVPSWSVADLSASGVGSNSVSAPEGDLAALTSDFVQLGQFPEVSTEAPSELTDAFGSMSEPRLFDLELRWKRHKREVAITPAGPCDLRVDGTSRNDATLSWSGPPGPLPWVLDEWQPSPTVLKYAALRGTEAVIVGLASLLALGVRTAEGTVWFLVRSSENAPQATTLARRMGLSDADDVRVFTDPKTVRLSTISNAIGRTSHVNPVGTVEPGPRLKEGAAEDALAAWGNDTEILVPGFSVLPHDLRVAIEQQVRAEAASRTILDIGAAIDETVTTDIGQEWPYEVLLAPGQTDARRIDKSTRRALDAGFIDREGHFGEVHTQCGYCGGLTCGMCISGIVACDCCAIAICKRCVVSPQTSLWLCPACTSTRRPNRSEARAHGRLLTTKGMLIGADALHTVVVEQSKSRWIRHGDNGDRQAIAHPSVVGFFNERLAHTE